MKIAQNEHYAIFASGQGSNAKALIEVGKNEAHLPKLIIVTNENSSLKGVCDDFGIEFRFIPTARKGIDLDLEGKILSELKKFSINWVFLAGFLKVLSQSFLDEFKNGAGNEVFNIHPSLLPLYPGLGGYKKAYANRDKYYGHSIHLVSEIVDGGRLVSQRKLEANFESSFDDFVSLGKKLENENYARVLSDLLNGRFIAENL